MKLALAGLAAVFASTPSAFAANCEGLISLAIRNVSITTAEVKPVRNVPSFCRVAGAIKPTSDSDIRFEVWLPLSGWNGKLEGVGNGGYAGRIDARPLATWVSRGYAVAATDTGHQASGNDIDATWASGHPEKIVDFGYRAIHETAVAARAVIQAFYGEATKRAYFNSCSNGGRQALMEAQRFPDDYDGIVAGAPANYWTHLLSSAVFGTKATLADPASYVSPAKLPALEAAALAACDSLDGVKDGVIDDPRVCRFDPSVLRCKGAESDACLTASQLAAVKAIYAGPGNFPGLSPGGEAERDGWATWVTGDAAGKSNMTAFGTQFFRNMVYGDPAWDFRAYDVTRDTKTADLKMAATLNAVNPDLSAFRARGGKLIVYHGWSDAAIPPLNAIDYYQSVTAKMGVDETAAFARLYMVPGMQHCGGGAGSSLFDAQTPLEAWVEHDTAPGPIVAKGPAERTRPLCAYPQKARYKGTGSTDDAANFTCTN